MLYRPFASALFLAVTLRVAAADTLTLKDGQIVEGRYLSSTETSIQFEVNGKPFTYSTWLVRELRFGSGGSSLKMPQAAYTGPRGKEQQDHFCAVLMDYIHERNRVSAEPNPIRRAELHPPDPWSYEDKLAAVFGPNGEFVDWTGRLFFTVTGSAVVLTFQPTCPAGSSSSFTTGYPADSRQAASSVRIPLSSPIAQKLRNASPGGLFRVSGNLLVRPSSGSLPEGNAATATQPDSRQRFEGAQANTAANVTNPQYLARFTDLTPAR